MTSLFTSSFGPRLNRFGPYLLGAAVGGLLPLGATFADPAVPVGGFLERNRGQFDAAISYFDRRSGTAFSRDAMWHVLQHVDPSDGTRWMRALRLRFEGAGEGPGLEPLDPLPTRAGYFVGEPGQWHPDVGVFGSVRIADLYPGVDLLVHADRDPLEYDFQLAPGTSPECIAIRVEGAVCVVLDQDGGIWLETEFGTVRHSPPRVFQPSAVGPRPLPSRFLLDGDLLRIEVSQRDPAAPLVIDPQVFSTYLGGSGPTTSVGREAASAVAIDDQGSLVVTGITASMDFPILGALSGPIQGSNDAFVSRLSSDGTQLLQSCFLGGSSSNEWSFDLTIDPASGDVIVAGYTASVDFPVSSTAFQKAKSGSQFVDAFLTRFDAGLSAILYSTYLGGLGWDEINGIDVAPDGRLFVAGHTVSSGLATSGAAQAALASSNGDGFLAIFDTQASGAASLPYFTYFGGDGYEELTGIAISTRGTAWVSGPTFSTNVPVTSNALDATLSGVSDVCVAEFDAATGALLYASYLGGSNSENSGYAEGECIAAGPDGGVFLVGETLSADFPVTPSAFQTTFTGTLDAFVTRIDVSPSGAYSLGYSTFLGGSGTDRAIGVDADGSGNAYVTGQSIGPAFPITPGSPQGTWSGTAEAFVAHLEPTGGELAFSRYFGGNGTDQGTDVVVDQDGSCVLVGTTSGGLPTTAGAFQNAYGGGATDAFVAGLSLLPAGVVRIGAPSASNPTSCLSASKIGVVGGPVAGLTFSLTCSDAPAGAAGYLLISLANAQAPISGITLLLAPPLVLLPAQADANGYSRRALALPPGSGGITFYAQYVWFGTASCGPLGALAASGALGITVQ